MGPEGAGSLSVLVIGRVSREEALGSNRLEEKQERKRAKKEDEKREGENRKAGEDSTEK